MPRAGKGGKSIHPGAKASKERSALRRAEMAPEVVRLKGLGFGFCAIAKRVGSTPKVVEEVWEEHVNRYLEAQKTGADAILAETMAQIETDLAEAGKAWERSKRDKRKIRREKGSDAEKKEDDPDKKDKGKVVYEREGRLPEPAYLTARNAIRDQRNKLLGIYKPVKAEVTGKDGGPIETRDLSDIERAARIIALLRRGNACGAGQGTLGDDSGMGTPPGTTDGST